MFTPSNCLPADRRRSRGRRQQQRRGHAADAGGARGWPRGHRFRAASWSRSAAAFASRRDGAVGRAPARGGHDQPHAHRRLRGRHHRRTAPILRVHPSNFTIEGFTERPASRLTGSAGASTSRSSRILAAACSASPARRRGARRRAVGCSQLVGRRERRDVQRRQAPRRPAGRASSPAARRSEASGGIR